MNLFPAGHVRQLPVRFFCGATRFISGLDFSMKVNPVFVTGAQTGLESWSPTLRMPSEIVKTFG